MELAKRATWSSRSTFILAAVGSAVGLGNAWRFPGLVAKHGGGAFLFVYLIAMLIVGVPLLMMEIAIGRKTKKAAPSAMQCINKKAEFIGWAATSNAFVIATYYAVIFGWVLLMALYSFKFAGITNAADSAQQAGNLWMDLIQTSGTFEGFSTISWKVAVSLIIAWILIYLCIRKSVHSVGKIVKYTVFIPIVILVMMAIKGLTMPGSMQGLYELFVPDFSQLYDAQLWLDAIGQVFFSLSIMMAVMFAYGSFLDNKSNIAVDAVIIAVSDIAISLLAGVVIFTTMYATGMTTENMSISGISTAFIIYPTSIVQMSDNALFNAVFGALFYLCLVTLAIDSAFSIVEGVSSAIADKFQISHKKATVCICIISGILSLGFSSAAGLAMLDVVDNWTNNFNMIIIGVLECIVVGWLFKTKIIVDEINKNTIKFKVPTWWFVGSVKYVSPILLLFFFSWNVYALISNGGIYGIDEGYTLISNILLGWLITALVFASGFIINKIYKISKHGNQKPKK